VRPVQARPHALGGGAVMPVGRQDLGLEQQALRVDHRMALAAIDGRAIDPVRAAEPAHTVGR
jgi:hypothetical protein